jgi:hypothetical protein
MVIERKNLERELSEAVKWFWQTRTSQQKKQKSSGRSDQGARSAVTGGAQMDGFNRLVTNLILQAGVERTAIFHKKALELPGYFRPEKKWDLLVVKEGQLIAAVEAKSQVGPSFGNNFNNRTEEAIGSAVDIWTAYREGIFNKTVKPWLGYIFMLEDCPKSNVPVSVKEPHFEVFPEFKGASYCRRYEILCRKLVRERHYCATCFMTSKKQNGLKGIYSEPAKDLSIDIFAKSLISHIKTYL